MFLKILLLLQLYFQSFFQLVVLTLEEAALRDYSNIKAHSRAIYLASRDWLDVPNPALQEKSKNIIKNNFSEYPNLVFIK